MFSFYNGQHASPFHREKGTSFGFPLSPPPSQPSPTFIHTESSGHIGTSALNIALAQKELVKWPPSIYVTAVFEWP